MRLAYSNGILAIGILTIRRFIPESPRWLFILPGAAHVGTTVLRALAAAEAAGGARACLDLALDYARVREQFGRTIGGFQAVKHHLANLLDRMSDAFPGPFGLRGHPLRRVWPLHRRRDLQRQRRKKQRQSRSPVLQQDEGRLRHRHLCARPRTRRPRRHLPNTMADRHLHRRLALQARRSLQVPQESHRPPRRHRQQERQPPAQLPAAQLR